MKKKKIIIISSIVLVLAIVIGLFISTGGARTDVYLKEFSVDEKCNQMIIKVGVSNSAGYVRKMKQTSGSMNYYFTFYSTYGINSKLGSEDTYEIQLDNNVDAIYFYTGGKGYKKVLELNDDGEWVKVSSLYNDELKETSYTPTEIENVSISISDISLTGATIVIKDTNKKQNTYTDWYIIEKEVNGKWYQLETKEKDYGFNDMAYLPNKNNEVKFVIDWEWLYGELSQGSYRILKKVNDGSAKIISIEFGIATTS